MGQIYSGISGGKWVSFQPALTYIERFNRTARYEWLSQYEWENLEHVQDHATRWMWSYNHERPNMALGGFTPKQRLAMAASVSTSASQ